MAETQFGVSPSNTINGREMWNFDENSDNPTAGSTCSKISEFLYIGGYMAAENIDWLKKIGITCVINVRKVSVTNIADDIEYVDIAVDDEEYEPIHWYFLQTADKIEAHRIANGRILVNCEMGISRSATICMMYMVLCQKLSLRQAYFHLKSIRPCIRPNYYFWKMMTNREKELRGGKASVSMMNVAWATRPVPDVYLL